MVTAQHRRRRPRLAPRRIVAMMQQASKLAGDDLPFAVALTAAVLSAIKKHEVGRLEALLGLAEQGRARPALDRGRLIWLPP